MISNTGSNEKANAIIQSIVKTAMESPVLCDEIYLQLIKLTSNCPDQDGLVLKIIILIINIIIIILINFKN